METNSLKTVSYTHLDVYKRQAMKSLLATTEETEQTQKSVGSVTPENSVTEILSQMRQNLLL